MQLDSYIVDLISLADCQRVERAVAGLQDGSLTVQILSMDFNVITASVHSKNGKSYGVLLARKNLNCSCPDRYYRGHGEGAVCKHIISTAITVQEMQQPKSHFTHKVI